jgi:uncharacterized damage-inducible protein DinB
VHAPDIFAGIGGQNHSFERQRRRANDANSTNLDVGKGNIMIGCEYAVMMSEYNEWMSAKLYEAAGQLSSRERAVDRKAFFGSIIGTLNHVVVGDTIWLKRFSSHPARHASLDPIRDLPVPSGLNEILFAELDELFARRKMLDSSIRRWAAELSESDLEHVLSYKNMAGVSASKPLAGLLVTFFNHQTHHRGQATTLLSQAGVDVGVTDFVALLPDAGHA